MPLSCSRRTTGDRAFAALGPARTPAPRHGDGRCIDNMTFNAVCLQQPVDPKAVQPGFLDHHNLHRTPVSC
jgi:hypothetical protein